MKNEVSILEEYQIKAFKMVMIIMSIACLVAVGMILGMMTKVEGMMRLITIIAIGIIFVEIGGFLTLRKYTIKDGRLDIKLYRYAKNGFIVACALNNIFLNFLDISVDVLVIPCALIALAVFFIELPVMIMLTIILQSEMIIFCMIKPEILNTLGSPVTISIFLMVACFLSIMVYFISSILIKAKKAEYQSQDEKLQGILNKVTLLMKELSQVTQTAVTVVEKESQSMEEIAVMSERMSTSNQEMLRNSEQNVKNIEYIGTSSQEISDKMKVTQNTSVELVDISAHQEQEPNEILKIGTTLDEATGYTLNSAESLQNNTKRIDDMLKIIEQVAEETNLLALNASIEAARVGEAGKGFAVVAQQVRKLSESTKVSLDNVNQVVEEFKRDVENVECLTRQNTEQIKSQNSAIHEMVLGMKQMIEKLNLAAQAVQEVEQLSDQQNSKMKETMLFNEEVEKSIEEEINRFAAIDQLLQENKTDIQYIGRSMNQLNELVTEIETLL